MEVMFFVQCGYRKQARAIVHAEFIVRETKHTVRFKLLDGSFLTIKRRDIISIE